MEENRKLIRKSDNKKTARKLRSAAELRADDTRRRMWEDRAYRQRVMESRCRTAATPEEFKRKSQTMKRIWADPNERRRRGKAISRGLLRPDVRTANSERNKRRWADQEMRKQASESMKRTHADPEMRKRISEGTRKALSDPAVRERIGMASKRAWAKDPTRRQRHGELTRRMWEEHRSKLAAALPTDWRDKSPLWWIIGIELLSQDYMSNSELAGRLDASNILKCPYGQSGGTWKSSVNQKACSEFIRKIRVWVGKSGKAQKSAA